jgi:hypothetical protein
MPRNSLPYAARRLAAALAAAGALAGCDLDENNPNAPTAEATLTSPDGIIAVAVGLQSRYAAGYGNLIYDAGLLTDELGATAQALPNVRDAELGRVENLSGVASDLWFSHYRTIKTANDLINNAPNVQLDPAMLSGIMALAYTLKAGAISDLVQGYQQIADPDAASATPAFISRADALARALAALDSADAQLNATPPGTAFATRVLGTNFDLRNTLRAFRARMLRLSGPAQQQAALTAANAVDRRVLSVLQFTDQVQNPLFINSAGSSAVLPRDAFRLAADPARATYHVTAAAVTGFFQPLDNYARYNVATGALPLYFPDEMLLIKAEALVGLGQLAAAQAALDSVRTDCGGLVATDPNACLAPLPAGQSAAALTAEIYANRRFELFATGHRWEDARRQGLVGATSVAKRCWLPYPIAERNANPANVPADPEAIDPPAAPANCF